MANTMLSLIESYMQLFEVHIDTACLNRMQVLSNHGYHIQRKCNVTFKHEYLTCYGFHEC